MAYTLQLNDVDFDASNGVIKEYKGNQTDIIIPDNFGGVPVTEIGKDAFNPNNNASVASDYEIVEDIEKVNPNPVLLTCLLTDVVIPDSVTIIGERAFFGNLLRTLFIGSNVQEIREEAFYGNKLQLVSIPNSVNIIEDKAFYGNPLVLLSIGSNVQKIGEEAFWENNLLSVKIPNSVNTIGNKAFFGNNQNLANNSSITLPRKFKTSIEKKRIFG